MDQPLVQGSDLARILEAVAALDVFYEGDNDDAYCPFGCGRDDFVPDHRSDCPITLARRALGG